ncbi:MAG: serine/threonine-protein kinase [Verrucomicrobia bacterium]|nr:serine/threonine-protein kinase [Verrucomicrobiota bacterium]
MTDNFDNREETLFQKCLDVPPEDWEQFLESSCPDDRELRETVLRLLKANQKADGFLEAETSQELLESDSSGIAAELQRIAPAGEGPGDQIDRYRLLELIGEGSWGSVWMAEQTEDIERRVALKILKLGLDTKDFLARFEAERQMLAMMDHPNIAHVLDAGATSYGRPYFVMELIRGMPVLDYADRERLSIEDRVELFIQICQATQHAHQKGIIHRDLKPSNILVAEVDDKPLPKIIDFGIAKTTQFHLTDKTVYTQFHTFLGTPIYSSPEQLEFSGLEVDHRTDIYSLGALLYELLCGRTLFDPEHLSKQSLENLRAIIREEDPPTPSLRLARLSPDEKVTIADKRVCPPTKVESRLKGDLDRIVMKCLEKDRSRRYESARALAQDLQAFLENKPVSTAAPVPAIVSKNLSHANGQLTPSGWKCRWSLSPALP